MSEMCLTQPRLSLYKPQAPVILFSMKFAWKTAVDMMEHW